MIHTRTHTHRIHPEGLGWRNTHVDVDEQGPLDSVSRHPHPPLPPIVSLIGETPLVRLTRTAEQLHPPVSVYVKLEGLNPGGSVKDRAALSIVQQALWSGALTPGKTLIDATSGNTGIAYAMLGAALGFPVQLTMAANASPERVQILRAYGAQLTLTDPALGTDGARRFVHGLVTAEPDRFFHADQYSNPANPLAHYTTTGPEVWRQTEGQITHFVAGLGTSGTMMGTGRYLRERNRAIKLVGVQPESAWHGISGLKHLATAEVPAIYDPNIVDRVVGVRTDDAQTMTTQLARQEGLFVGVSAGAAVVAAIRVAKELSKGIVVALLPDGGYKYTSAQFWAE